MVTEPDYIIESNKPNTAVILKEIVHNGERFQTILRLCTSLEPNGYKNSIITFMKIDKKRGRRTPRLPKTSCLLNIPAHHICAQGYFLS